MNDQRPLRLGTRQAWGRTTCGFGFGLPDPECERPATTHVMWLNTRAVSPVCTDHLRFVAERADQPYEIHAFGSDCGMPGSLWHHPYEDEEEGYCIFPAVDDASLLVEARVPLGDPA